jgi:putative ABC transport system ATP-binding protein
MSSSSLVSARAIPLSAAGLVVSRQGRDVLSGVSLGVEPGDSISIMGPSGSGKSTLLHCLAGLLVPDSGSVTYGKTSLEKVSPARRRSWRLTNCGLVFQFGELLPELTLRENAELPQLLLGVRLNIASRKVEQLFDRVGISDVADRVPAEVSGGQMQRAAIVRAVAHDPAVVLADEPTGALDSAASELVMQVLLATTQGEGRSLVLVSHDETVASAAARRFRMDDGVLSPWNRAWT